MAGTDPGTETVFAYRAARVTDHGVSVANWDDVAGRTQFVITGCNVQPGASTEDNQYREGQRVAYTVFMPRTDTTAALTGDDRVLIRGHLAPIVGDPEDWPDPDPMVAHVKVLAASWRDLG